MTIHLEKPVSHSGFAFSDKSLQKLDAVHPLLVRVCQDALKISELDFAITSGLRTEEEQKMLVESGKSQIMKSKHLQGLAVDVVPYINGGVSWEEKDFYPIARAFFIAGHKHNVVIDWGGFWKTFKDCPHFELREDL